ncbi:MAG TPA: 30S ribosomal protein S8 [Acidimicrobiia bacterium]|nr:30S ribosomal protein S8 [Acidimicrobiia bacterium]
MSMTDPVADMLTRIRNANLVFHEETQMPTSKLKENLARILKAEGYIEDFSVEDATDRPGRTLRIRLKYTSDRKRTITGLKRVSKPGLRVYTNADTIPRVLGGLGIAILSTNQGLLTDREARERRVGGEIICQVW